jgi:hypothetical protein
MKTFAALAAVASSSARVRASGRARDRLPQRRRGARRCTPTPPQFESQDGWVIVATSEHGNPVLWSFTPRGPSAHPAVSEAHGLEKKGTGYVELDVVPGTGSQCVRLLERVQADQSTIAQSNLAKRILLDVGIAQNDHDRAREALARGGGKAAEIRMDDLLKVVIVPRGTRRG